MQKHTKIHFDFFDIAYDPVSGWHDWVDCEVCGLEAVDIHHIDGRGKDKDVIENLMRLCRKHHTQANIYTLPKSVLIDMHFENMKRTGKPFNENYFKDNKS